MELELYTMALFNEKVLRKHTASIKEIPVAHLEVIQAWADKINNGTMARLNEVEVHAAFTNQIMVKLLGYVGVTEADKFTVAQEYPVAGGGQVDLALGHFCGDKSVETVVAPFELKGAKSNLDAMMSGRHKTPVQQAFEYVRDIKGAKWVLLSNYVELRLYAVSETSLVYESFLFTDLLDPAEYAKFQLLLSQDNFLSGNTEQLLKDSENADKDISDKLYTDYKALREQMLHHLIQDNSGNNPSQLIAPAQKLLDRVLFVSFAEDKGLIPDDTIKRAFQHQDPYNPRPIYQNFIGLFNAIDKGNKQLNIPAYNGGLFALDPVLDQLNVSDELCEGFKNLSEYDFDSEVSVTVLGRIFEQSIADLEVLISSVASGDIQQLAPDKSKKTTAVTGKRKKFGVVYTPDNITQFIVANTLGTHIDERFKMLFIDYGKYKADGSIQWKKGKKIELQFWYAWQETLQAIKVVDPACGSGAFMVAAFDYLYVEYEKTNEQIGQITGQRSVLDLNKEILNNNLFGVDINAESIEITKLSLWLKTAERGKKLETLDGNFIAGNSLGFDEPAPDSDFCWQRAFPDIFAKGGFDVVLGNPPYVRMELLKDLKPWLQEHYQVASERMDLYGYFFELGIKLLNTNGRLAYISNATFFKTGSGEKLRNQLSQKIRIEKIIDFADLQVFEGVTTYPAILVLQQGIPESTQEIQLLKLIDNIPEDLHQYFQQHSGIMQQSQLDTTSWQLEDARLYTLRKKFNQYPSLKTTYGSPFYGIKTGCNEAFVIDRTTRDNIVAQDPMSSEIIKPFLEGKDLKSWHAQPRNLYIIYIPKSVIDIDNYPGIKQWLLPFKQRLEQRATKQEWFELQQAQLAYKPFLEQPKIFYPDITDSAKFHWDDSGSFAANTAYFLPIEDQAIAAYLNSKVVWFFLQGVCDFVRGGFLRLFSQNIELIPIPKGLVHLTTASEQLHALSKKRYQCENSFRRRLQDLCPDDQVFKLNKKLVNWWSLDFSNLQKELKKTLKATISLAERNDWQDYFESEQVKRAHFHQQIQGLEQQLNNEIYKLFDLSTEEILLIEQSVRS